MTPVRKASFSSNSSDDRPKQQTTETAETATEYGLVWIMYMRFAMRSEGVKPSRAIFAKARKDRRTPWEVYEAAGGFLCSTSISLFPLMIYTLASAALMEYHWLKRQIGSESHLREGTRYIWRGD